MASMNTRLSSLRKECVALPKPEFAMATPLAMITFEQFVRGASAPLLQVREWIIEDALDLVRYYLKA